MNNSPHLIVIMMRAPGTVPCRIMELGGITLVLSLTSTVYGSNKLKKVCVGTMEALGFYQSLQNLRLDV